MFYFCAPAAIYMYETIILSNIWMVVEKILSKIGVCVANIAPRLFCPPSSSNYLVQYLRAIHSCCTVYPLSTLIRMKILSSLHVSFIISIHVIFIFWTYLFFATLYLLLILLSRILFICASYLFSLRNDWWLHFPHVGYTCFFPFPFRNKHFGTISLTN